MNTKPKFITPVAMKATEEQFENDLRKPLEALGYSIRHITDFERDPYLYNIINHDSPGICNSRKQAFFGVLADSVVDHYNPDLFLALAAQTDGYFPIKGEWIICVKHCENQYRDLLHIVGELYKMESCDSTIAENESPHNISEKDFFKEYFRKPTKDELIAHFTKKSGVMVTVVEQKFHTDEELKNAVDRNQRIESALINLVQLRTYKQEFGETELFKKMEKTCWREAVEALEP